MRLGRRQCAWASCIMTLGLACSGDQNELRSNAPIDAQRVAGAGGAAAARSGNGGLASFITDAAASGVGQAMPSASQNAADAGSATHRSAGAGGDLMPMASRLDPNASFDWPETQPGQATCQAGTYT